MKDKKNIVSLETVSLIKDKNIILNNIDLNVAKNELIVVKGGNGSGKTQLGLVISNNEQISSGKLKVLGEVGYLSFEQAEKILNKQRDDDDSDLTNGPIYQGELLRNFISRSRASNSEIHYYADKLNLTHLLDRGIRFMSNGELRKAIFLDIVLSNYPILFLDEPFEGVDSACSAQMKDIISHELSKGKTVIMILNHFKDIPKNCNSIINLENGKIESRISYNQAEKNYLELKNRSWNFGIASEDNIESTIISMNEISVSYNNRFIFNLKNWSVKRKEQWLVYGPNGCGKSSLLGMISGDNIKAYGQDISILGFKKGSGESVWDIKKGIGWVSRELHNQYRVNIPLIHVVISGYFDSIGIYEKPSLFQIESSKDLLSRVGFSAKEMNKPFKECSYGEQRLAILLRAIIKKPKLLILDEPSQGLDDEHRLMFENGLTKLIKNSNITTLYVTHRKEEIPNWLTHQLVYTKKEMGYQAVAAQFNIEKLP